jgi:L-arabinose isomerase
MDYKNLEVWFITGAQLLYGGDAVVKVDAHSNEMVAGLNASGNLPVKVVYKGTANSSSEISEIMRAANGDTKCIGLITWMHTFSPAKMWIHGLMDYKKPLLHLHTQFNEQIPWSEIDMDYMNLNQSAHGDREFGFITSRLRKPRKVVVGFWKDKSTQSQSVGAKNIKNESNNVTGNTSISTSFSSGVSDIWNAGKSKFNEMDFNINKFIDK